MDKESLEKHLRYAGEYKPSMKRRASANDYHERRIYMITLVVEGRRALLGHIEGDVNAGRVGPNSPHLVESPLGAAVARVWKKIPEYHPEVEIISLQLMPDHLHGILFVTRHLPEGLGKVILGFKQACNKEYRRLFGSTTGLNNVMQAAVSQQPTQPHTGHEAGLLFERGYNDSILLREGQLEVMKAYLAENPYRLALKRTRPELLRVREGIEIGQWQCSAVGNIALLTDRERLQVRISRSIAPELLEMEKQRFLSLARQGAVLVSPSISPGEKEIMRAAFEEGLPLIVLLSNGFDSMQKPSGERFYACAEGRLLLLSPFPHSNNRQLITREACNTLNALAWEICKH